MRGMTRVLNAQHSVKFPYPKTFIKSLYKEEFKPKAPIKQEPFNLEKEKQYFPRPQTSTSTTVDRRDRPQITYLTTAREAFKDPSETAKYMRS